MILRLHFGRSNREDYSEENADPEMIKQLDYYVKLLTQTTIEGPLRIYSDAFNSYCRSHNREMPQTIHRYRGMVSGILSQTFGRNFY